MNKPLRRMRDFPEIMDAERAAILDDRVAHPHAILDAPIIAKAAQAACGADHYEIHHWINEATLALMDQEDCEGDDVEAAWVAAEKQDQERLALVGFDINEWPPYRTDAEVLAFYNSIGWDPTNEYGQLLRVAANLIFPFQAASKAAGPARFPEEGIETARIWAEKIAARPKPKAPSAPTPAISVEESRRRDAEARSSNVWRPDPKK